MVGNEGRKERVHHISGPKAGFQLAASRTESRPLHMSHPPRSSSLRRRLQGKACAQEDRGKAYLVGVTDLRSILAPGPLANAAVLDRACLTVPAGVGAGSRHRLLDASPHVTRPHRPNQTGSGAPAAPPSLLSVCVVAVVCLLPSLQPPSLPSLLLQQDCSCHAMQLRIFNHLLQDVRPLPEIQEVGSMRTGIAHKLLRGPDQGPSLPR